MTIRPAVPEERAALEALMRRASVQATRYGPQLEAHPEVVVVPAEDLARGRVRVAEQDGARVGFATLLSPVDRACELDAIFVEPARMGTGIGRALLADAIALARRAGAERVDVVANLDAVGFYERSGFVRGPIVATRFGPAVRMSVSLHA